MITHNDVVCLACGCLCDDLQVSVENNQFLDIYKACSVGDAWLRRPDATSDSPEAFIDGQPVAIQHGISAAANLLLQAKFPLIYGLHELDIDGQRAACALADEVGAALDSGTRFDPASIYFPTVGSMGCTWGEVIQRADVIVYWHCDPDALHPRHRERILERIQSTRSVQVISDIPTDWDFNTIWQLRALVQGRPFERVSSWWTGSARLPPSQTPQECGSAGASPSQDRFANAQCGLEQVEGQVQFAETLQSGKYVAIVHASDHPNTLALQALATDVNRYTRCRLVPLASASNPTGAAEVLTWQTGYPNGVGFQRGYPVATGSEFSAERMLCRGEVDLAVVIGGADNMLSEEANNGLRMIPQVQLVLGRGGQQLGELTPAARQIALFASVPGINTSGAVFRSDRVTLPVRPILSTSLPSPALVLNEVRDAVRSARPAKN